MINWYEEAQRLLTQEGEAENLSRAAGIEPIRAIVKYKGREYMASLAYMDPKYTEVVILSKQSNPMKRELSDAIKNLDGTRAILRADDSLDLSGPKHTLRRLESRLTNLTTEQIMYELTHPTTVILVGPRKVY